MTAVERHTSPDRLMELVVTVEDGDWTIGFEGCPWHTHGDILSAWGYEGPPEAATRAFAGDIIGSRREIIVYRIDGKVRDIAVPGDCDERPLDKNFAKYAFPGETMEVRYWNGEPATTAG